MAGRNTVVTVTMPGVGLVPATFGSTGAVWRYFDRTNDWGASWRNNSFDDSSWSSGVSELGFGDIPDGRPETTPVQNNLQCTTYFRRKFYVPDATLVTSLNAQLLRDDGAVVYLNGVEV